MRLRAPRRGRSEHRIVFLHAGIYSLVLGVIALLSWLGQGYGYLILYGSVIAALGLV